MIDFETAQGELFESVDLDVQSRLVDLDEPRVRLHIFEAGRRDDEPPLLFVHGGGAFGGFLAPLMACRRETAPRHAAEATGRSAG